MGEEAEILARTESHVGRLTLNRPRALHALNIEMCQALTEALEAWRGDAAVGAVLLDHAGPRGFCAGGDVRRAAQSGAGDGAEARAFFSTEYRLNALMFDYPKPILAIMDGVTMGGGAGLAMPARWRVATEHTLFAMPEAAIGLFPDVGAGWWLPRLPGEAGPWLALTGARLGPADCLALGVATHFVPAAQLEAFKAAALAGEGEAAARIEAALETFAADPGPAPVAGRRADIDRLFGQPSAEAIFAALEADGGAWAGEQLAALRKGSPTTLKVALRLLAEGAARTSFAEEMAVEYALAARICASHDFIEGVRAVLVDKDGAPRWDPATLAGVTPAQVDALFAPLGDEG